MKFSVIITSSNEPQTVGKAVRQVINPNKELWDDMELIVIAPDSETINAANSEIRNTGFKNINVLKDDGIGKPQALNLAVSKASSEILIFTDGDMYIDKDAIKLLLPFFDNKIIGGVSGHPLPLNSDQTQFGFYSHVFTKAAHLKRLSCDYIHMSGYLYAIRNIPGLFPIPVELRAEDAYISRIILKKGYQIDYEPNALAYVRFPKNMNDWMSQKLRSLGGNIQLKNYFNRETTSNMSATHQRSIIEDFTHFLVPFTVVKNAKQFAWIIKLYPLRLYLWMRVYLQHMTGSYSKGKWKRIESTKQKDRGKNQRRI